MRSMALAAMVMTACLICASASAQRPRLPEKEVPAGDREAWYYESGYEKPTPRQIIQRKAQARAAARIHRLETMAAYGMSNARPTAAATPHTGMYSPAWQMPGGRPFAWYSNQRPQYLIWR